MLDQVFDADSLYALRAAVAAHGSQAGLPEGRVGDLVLAVHELAANAVRHGAGRGRLRVWNTGEMLRCEVTDDGAARSPAAGEADTAAGDAAQWRIEPGHGLWVVRQIADQTSVQASATGTCVAVSFASGAPGELPTFHLAQRSRDGCTVISMTGELDLSSAGQLTSAVSELAAAPAVRLVLDLAGLTQWDSSGLAALILAQQRVSARPDARMVVVGLPGHLTRRLRAAALHGEFTLAATVTDAVGMLLPPA